MKSATYDEKSGISGISKYLNDCSLPLWDEIPDLGLYMEQVLALLSQYLYFMPSLKDEPIITAAAINNYVRNGVMPEPRKKRYYRFHIAYLIMIITLKQSLSLALVQKVIPVCLTEDDLKKVYTSYAETHERAVRFFNDKALRAVSSEFESFSGNEKEIIPTLSIISGLSKLLSERLLLKLCPDDNTDKKPHKKEKKAK